MDAPALPLDSTETAPVAPIVAKKKKPISKLDQAIKDRGLARASWRDKGRFTGGSAKDKNLSRREFIDRMEKGMTGNADWL